jgi:hypothetical protein
MSNGCRCDSGVGSFSIRRHRIAEGYLTNGIFPIFNLLPVFIRTRCHPAVPAGHLGIGSPAVEFGAPSAENAFQFRHGYLLRRSTIARVPMDGRLAHLPEGYGSSFQYHPMMLLATPMSSYVPGSHLKKIVARFLRKRPELIEGVFIFLRFALNFRESGFTVF